MSMTSLEIEACLIYSLCLFGTGALIAVACGIQKNFFAVAVGLSITVLVTVQLAIKMLGIPVTSWWITTSVIVVVSSSVALFIRRLSSKSQIILPVSYTWGCLTMWAVLTGMFGLYHWTVGPYTEIPSDFWSHLGNVKEHFEFLESVRQDNPEKLEDKQFGRYSPIVILHAQVADLFGVMPIQLVRPATFVTSIVLLTSVFWLTYKIGYALKFTNKERIIASMCASILFFLTFGVSSFSYVRYYGYFPHIVNFSMMFLMVGLLINLINQKRVKTGSIIFLIWLLAVSAVINFQEFVFSSILLFAMIAWWAGRILIANGKRLMTINIRIRIGLVVALGGIVSLILFLPTTSVEIRAPHLIDLGVVHEAFSGWPVVNPKARFWETLGWFGIVIYLWYFWNWKRMRGVEYLNVAMLSPLLTMFNPFFVYWFLQYASWDSIWRLSFLMPIPVAGGVLVAMFVKQISETGFDLRSKVSATFLITMVACIFPFSVAGVVNEGSRLPSLASVDETNGAGLWGDLISEMNKMPVPRTLITDSITNYVLSTATKHSGQREPKERWQTKKELFGGDYKDSLLYYGADDHLIVINLRNGNLSETGRISGHWWDDILTVDKHYPRGLRTFLKDSPKDFQMLWSSDRIEVYQVLRNPQDY